MKFEALYCFWKFSGARVWTALLLSQRQACFVRSAIPFFKEKRNKQHTSPVM